MLCAVCTSLNSTMFVTPSQPINHWLAARWLKWRHNIPYIFEVGDLYRCSPYWVERDWNGLLKNLLWRLEKKLPSVMSVVALSPAIQSAIEKKAPGIPVHMIPNMADTDYFQSTSKPTELEKKFNVKGKLVVAYFGAMGFANDWKIYFKPSRPVKSCPHFYLRAMAERTNLEQLAEQLQLNNVFSGISKPGKAFVNLCAGPMLSSYRSDRQKFWNRFAQQIVWWPCCRANWSP